MTVAESSQDPLLMYLPQRDRVGYSALVRVNWSLIIFLHVHFPWRSLAFMLKNKNPNDFLSFYVPGSKRYVNTLCSLIPDQEMNWLSNEIITSLLDGVKTI